MMTFSEIETRFNRAIKYTFSRKKILIGFLTLVLCAVIFIFGKTVSLNDPWMQVSLTFLSIFVASGVLLAVGVFLIRIYYHEVKSLKLNIAKIFSRSLEIMLGAAYLSFPLIVVFLILWILLGIFHFISKIPKLGFVFDSVLAFAPFILIFCLVFLCFINLGILFFAAPSIGLKKQQKLKIIGSIINRLKTNFFSNFLAFLIGILPLFIALAMIFITLRLTNVYSFYGPANIDLVRSFFVSLPICFVLTPFTVFFFNFAAEMHQLFLKK